MQPRALSLSNLLEEGCKCLCVNSNFPVGCPPFKLFMQISTQALLNDSRNLKSTIRILLPPPHDWFICSTASLCGHTDLKKNEVIVCLDFFSLSEVCYHQQSFIRAVIACTVDRIEFQSKRKERIFEIEVKPMIFYELWGA